MPIHYVNQSSAAQTSFANCDTAVRNLEMARTVAHLPGNFAAKQVKGRVYWYYQVKAANGVPLQMYIGPDSDAVRKLIQQKVDPEKQTSVAHVSQLSKACQILGCPAPAMAHGRVVKQLADCGFFRAGGILAGTHAFLAFQNHLGVTWNAGNTTMDIDFMHAGKSMSIALPATIPSDVHGAIESLQMGFFPVADHAKYIKTDEQDFVLDFLTVVGKSGMEPIFSKQLNIQLQPLKFMELSIEDPLQTAFLTRQGAVLINLPQPERFAVHKLIVQGERKGQPLKSQKDVVQASAVIEWLLDNNPDVLMERIREVQATGPGWRRRLEQGFVALQNKFPELHAALVSHGMEFEASDGRYVDRPPK